jgi:hypothetical protein
LFVKKLFFKATLLPSFVQKKVFEGDTVQKKKAQENLANYFYIFFYYHENEEVVKEFPLYCN